MDELARRLAATRLSDRVLPEPAACVLIGMAAVGKSTLGRRLARELAVPFIDTDTVLSERAGCSLEELLKTKGPHGFCDLEEEVVLSLAPAPAVIATGGSVIYRSRAMAHLQRFGVLFWLDAPTEAIIARHRRRDPAGLIWLPADLPTFDVLIEHRAELYRRAADFHVREP
ncbi:shikimate kinase [Candidatus Nitrospira bockiana]